MPHLFIDRLEELKERVARMTSLVQQVTEISVDALLQVDAKAAQSAFEIDTRIDAEEVQIEKFAIDMLALYQPAASDLRLITVIIKANSDFERIADCAVNVCQRVLPLTRGQYQAPTELRLIGNSVVSTLRDTIKAFNLSDAELARQVLRGDDVVDALYHQIVQDMLAHMEKGNGSEANIDLSNIMVAKNFERMADHCTNIAEDVIYAHTGRIIRHLHAV